MYQSCDRMSVTALYRPAHRESVDLIRTALNEKKLVNLFGRCRVSYCGRARSELPAGNRLVVCKPDGATLVHTAEGQEPVNWQPSGATISCRVADPELVIESQRASPQETLLIAFAYIEHITAYDVEMSASLTIEGTEKQLKQTILKHPEQLESGFEPRATERETAAGPVDIYGRDASGTPVAVELKRGRVGPEAASQLSRYVDALDAEFPQSDVRGILVAPSVTDRGANLLHKNNLEYQQAHPPTE